MSRLDERRQARLDQRRAELEIRAEQEQRNREADEAMAGGVVMTPEGEQRSRALVDTADVADAEQKAVDGPAENKSRTPATARKGARKS